MDQVTETETIKRRYNRTALFYDWMDFMISDKLRKKVIGMARGQVLEVGVGTGKNLPFYPPGCTVTGIDFSPAMLERAKRRAEKLNLTVMLLEMDAQHMDFADHTFDTVVATCVFCSVPDAVQGLREIKRVCKPGGQVILLEHVRSENPVWGKIMDVLNPVFLHMVGSNINRRTVQNVSNAGLKLKEVQDMSASKIVKLIIAAPNEGEQQAVYH
ncbi:class I SAM-dependent methyltransferase [Desulfotruncus alcoholivorax]|uniref:class I SAM-dependent methyltransferase n=1 Tax=Desulfotruncus alcoholivorax TaxID=265477 RepID=UPI00041D3E8C|nr:class I SAM-dependent methyltransferase [Desulfotruncus alcoholivorax]